RCRGAYPSIGRRRGLPRLPVQPGAARCRGTGRAGEVVERVGVPGHPDIDGESRLCLLWHRPAPGDAAAGRAGVHGRGARLPRPVLPQRQATDEMLRRGDHPGRTTDSVVRVQLRRLPRTGPRADVRRTRGRHRAERHRVAAADRRLTVPVQDRPRRQERRAPGQAVVIGLGMDPATVAACCAAAYRHDAVAVLLGDSYPPGRLALTTPLADPLKLRPGQRVADVACGPGTTARLLVAEYGVSVDGVDLNASTVDAPGVRFHTGDAERIPLPSNAFDALVCECAFCMFPDKQAAAAEFARLLRPGARLALPDAPISGRLPPELTGLAGWIACTAAARPARAYARRLSDAGLRIIHRESHEAAICRMLDQIEARVALLRIAGADWLAAVQLDLAAVTRYLDLARRAVADGIIGSTLLIAENP